MLSIRLGVGVVAVLALGASPASASIVFQDDVLGGGFPYYRLHESTAGPEANDVSLSIQGANYLVRDEAGLQASTGCTQVDATTATCPTAYSTDFQLEVHALNDTVRLDLPAGYAPQAFGGNDDDTFVPGPAVEGLFGNAGRDTVDYSGSPRVSGTSGDKPGSGVTVNLDSGAGSGTGTDANGDLVSEVEAVRGSRFGDTLTGSPEAETLVGEGGGDLLTGGLGLDTLLGANGNDKLFSADGVAGDVNNCGKGNKDRVQRDSGDSKRRCEIRL